LLKLFYSNIVQLKVENVKRASRNEAVGKAFLMTNGRSILHNVATFFRYFDFFYSHNSRSQKCSRKASLRSALLLHFAGAAAVVFNSCTTDNDFYRFQKNLL
jgi:hypothetical protein